MAKKKQQSKQKRQQQRARRAAADRPEPKDPLLREAELQTKAIMRLDVYKRLAYSLVAIGAILIGFGLSGYLGQAATIGGIVLVVIGIPCSAILYVGTKNGRKNVENIIAEYDRQHGTSEEHKRRRDVELKGETPESIRRLNERAGKVGSSKRGRSGKKGKR